MEAVVDGVRFEDIAAGMELPVETVGPVSQTTIVKFSGATGDFAPIHHDLDVAEERGLDGPIIMGPFMWGHLARWLLEWGGSRAILKELDMRMRRMALVGDTFRLQGVVSNTSIHSGQGEVECEVQVHNIRLDEACITAKCRVTLPVGDQKG